MSRSFYVLDGITHKNCTQRDSGGYFSASTILEKLKGISHSPRAVTGGLSTDTDSVSSSISARNVVDDLEGELTDVLQSRALSVDTIKGKLGNLTNKLGHGNV